MMDRLMKVFGAVKYVLLIFLLMFIVSLMRGDKISDTPIEDVTEAVTAAADMTDLSLADNRTVRRLYGINVNDYEGINLYVSDSNMKVEEVLVVKLKDASQAGGVESAVRSRVDTQLQSFEGYGPEQCKLLDDHVLDTEGNYVLFVVNEKAQAADQAFQNSL
ncbi:MAG TPA: DUF4358 domain-containing protein [Candidatus Mediterraneibacter pullistercoris]|nr:DUF4358 domain-containing protein [Candidatus Mediterraneibacter pullistercoris]